MTSRISIVGPTHPYKGGIAQHTTILARRLEEAGHQVEIVSWRHQYPKALYPGELYVPDGKPEVPEHSTVRTPLSWFAPWGWLRTARSLRDRDAAIFVIVNPIQGIAYWTMLRALRKARVRTIALFHNVVPHEKRWLDSHVTTGILENADVALAHTQEEADTASRLGARATAVTPLAPLVLPGADGAARTVRADADSPLRVLAFGLVREYKGIDLLIRAVAKAPHAHLTVAGEFWGGTGPYQELVDQLGIADRVELKDGYVASDEVAGYFADADVAALAYRSATSSAAAMLALDYGVPVVATAVGSLREVVEDGRYGLTVPAEDVDALAEALEEAADVEHLRRWDAALAGREKSGDSMWRSYVEAVTALVEAPEA